MKKTLLMTTVVGVFSLLFSSGCASVFGIGGEDQAVVVRAGELRAKYVVVSERTGRTLKSGLTPDTVPLPRSAGYFKRGRYRVEITHPNTGKVYTTQVKGKPTNWYTFGNMLWLPLFVIGAPIAWLGVDPGTGAMWKLHPRTVEAPF